MIDTAILALATFFATIGPIDVAAMFAVLTVHQNNYQKITTAIRGTLIATAILLLFAFAGEVLLRRLGISLAALQTAGGILLLLIGIEMVFARTSGGTSTTKDEKQEASTKSDISIFPLATPLIAGPGAMGATILLMANQEGILLGQIIVVISLLIILFTTFVLLVVASKVQHFLGITGMHVISRVIGVLLTALAVQFIFNGIQQSGLIAH